MCSLGSVMGGVELDVLERGGGSIVRDSEGEMCW